MRKIMNKCNYEHYNFFQDLVDDVLNMISDHNPNGMLRVSKHIITKLEYHDIKGLPEDLLNKVYNKVAIITGTDVETITEKMDDRIVIVRDD